MSILVDCTTAVLNLYDCDPNCTPRRAFLDNPFSDDKITSDTVNRHDFNGR